MPLIRIRRVTSGIERSTSSRTASPKRRRRISSSIASSRSSASSSSIAMSASRVTRNRWVSRISMPRNSSSRLASMTWSSSTNRSRSTSNRRGRSGGILTRANRFSPVSGSRSPTAIERRERADVRERVPRVHRERREDREDLVVEPLAERLVVLGDLVVVEDLDALGGELRRGSSAKIAACSAMSSRTRARIASSCSRGRQAVGARVACDPLGSWRRRPDTRTWKNSSRLLTRRSRGT